MLRSLIISVVLVGGGFGLSHFLIGYDKAGTSYLKQLREKRKSISVGSPYYRPGQSSHFSCGKQGFLYRKDQKP